jgi:hypothetical protein
MLSVVRQGSVGRLERQFFMYNYTEGSDDLVGSTWLIICHWLNKQNTET